MSFYVIASSNVTAYPRRWQIRFQDVPGQKNLSGEDCADGWLGCTNDTSEYALGAYPTRTEAERAARAFLAERGVDARWIETDEGGDLLESEYWDAGDWLYASRHELRPRYAADPAATVAVIVSEAAEQCARLDPDAVRRFLDELAAEDEDA